MKCTSCDNNLDLANNGFAVREDCMHTVCLDCSTQKICGACFKAQQLQQKKLREEKQVQVLQSAPVAPKLQKPVQLPQKTTQPQIKKQIKAEVGLRKVKIGNLPYSTTTEELSSIFSLCGGIEETLVFPFTDFKGEERNYGLITFSTEKAAKLALLHHNKVFRGHVITVASNKDATYSIFVSNFPSGNDKDNVMAFLKAYGEVKSVGKQQESKFFVNFAEDEVRRNVVTSNLQVPSQLGLVTLKISLKEPPKQTGLVGCKPDGDGFPLVLKEIPSRLGSKPLIEAMFELYGPITAKQMTFSKETHTVTWKIDFPTAVLRDQALLLNNRRPHKWNVNITLSIETQKGSSKNLQEKAAKPGTPGIKNTAKVTTKSTPTIAPTKKALTPGTSKDQITPQRSSKKEKAFSQPTLNAQKFAVKVTGFDTTVKETDLEGYFADAGTILELVNTQIYVGRLPEVTVEELRDLFSLCGHIDNVNLQTFIQRGGALNGYQVTYALISFVEGASIQKALFFINSVYKNRVLTIRKSNETKYGICVCQVPDGLSDGDIRSLFEKFGPLELVPEGKNMVFINFYTEEHRQQAVDEGTFYWNSECLPLRVTKKEYSPKNAPAVTYTGEEFSVYTTVKVGTTREELERMFTLCGALGTVFLEQGIGRITFLTQKGQRKALSFNRSIPDGWEEAIKISLEPPVESALSVFVTGINDDISEDLLREFFEDAGACTVDVHGFDKAVVTFENEECRDKALEFNGTAVGMTPGRRLKIVKRYVF